MKEKLLSKFIILALACLSFTACVEKKLNLRSNNERTSHSINNIRIKDSKLRIEGSGLDEISNVSLTDMSGNSTTFSIDSKNNNQIIANALSSSLFQVNQLLTMTIETAKGASTYTINVELPDLGASHGQTLQYNAITGEWIPANPSTSNVESVNGRIGAINLGIDDLTDTDTSGAVAGSVLKFNGANWVVGTDEGGASTNATSIHNRTISSTAPTDGQSLVWNSLTSSWIPMTITGGGAGSGEVNTASSTGTGASIFKQKVGSDLQFKSIAGSNDLSVNSSTNSVDLSINTNNSANQLVRLDALGRLPAIDGSLLTGISGIAGGEANTISSAGGASLFKQKTGSDLELRGIQATSDFTISQSTNTVDFQINTSNGAGQLLRLDSSGRLPAIDGSLLTGISGGAGGDTTIQSRDVSSAAPTNGQALLWNDLSSRWEPTTITAGGAGGEINTATSAGGTSLYQNKVGSNLVFKGLTNTSDIALTSNANDIEIGVNTSNTANQLLRLDAFGRLPAIDGSQLTGITGVASSDAVKLQSRDVALTVPTDGQALVWNNTTSVWEPQTIGAGESNTASSAGGTSLFQNKVGSDLVFKGLTNSSDISLTANANDIQIGVNAGTGASQLIRLDAFGRLPAVDGSQLTGIVTSDTTLSSRNVASTAPTDGQALVWNNTSSVWEPQTIAGGAGEANTMSSAGGVSLFKQKTGVDLILKGLQASSDFTVTGSTNTVDLQINTSNGAGELLRLDASGRLPAIDGSQLTGLAGGSGNATTIQSFSVDATAPTNGQVLLWNDTSSRWEPTTIVTGGAGGEANTASSAGGTSLFQSKVASNLIFKGLTNTSDITLTANTNDVQVGVNTSNGASQLVRLDAFSRLPAVDGSQLTGIVTTDTTLSSRNVSSTPPTDGQALVWNNASSVWEPQTISAGSGETNTASSVGGAAIFKQKTGSDLEFKGLTASSDLTITQNTNDLQLSVNTSNGAGELLRLDGSGRLPAIDGSQLTGLPSGSGEVNTASSLGGTSLVGTKSGVDLTFKGLTVGSDLSILDMGTSLDISINTANLADELLRLEPDGSLPALDAGNLFNLPSSDTTLQGNNVSSAAPSDTQVLSWNGSTLQWEPTTMSGAADDLGDHTATQNLAMGNNYISYSGLNEGLFVNLGGNVGIGTNTPAADLDILQANVEVKIRDSNVGTSSEAQFNFFVDGGEAGMSLLNTNYDWFGEGFPDSSWSDVFLFYTGPDTSSGMRFNTFAGNINFSVGDGVYTDMLHINATDFNVGIKTTTPGAAFALDVNGLIRTTGAVDTTSDRRYKKNIKKISSEVSILDQFKLIDGVYFDWKHKEYPEKDFREGRDIGVIAQDVRKVFPEAVTEDENGFLSVAYAKLVAPLIEAVKELVGITDSNKRDIASLEARTQKLETENKMLKEALCEMNPKAKICNLKK